MGRETQARRGGAEEPAQRTFRTRAGTAGDDDVSRSGSRSTGTRHDVAAFLIIGLLGIPLLALAVGALFLPPGISFVLIRRGLGEDHPSWVVLGALAGLMWIAMLVAAISRLRRRS